MTDILAIDPGNIYSAYILYPSLREFGKVLNSQLRNFLEDRQLWYSHLAVEMMEPRGMPTAKEEMLTLVELGRFIECASPTPYTSVYRRHVKLHLCGVTRAKDSNIRRAIIDRYEPTGGGKVGQIGVKSAKGPLYGVSQDVWQALGLAITFVEHPDYAESAPAASLSA